MGSYDQWPDVYSQHLSRARGTAASKSCNALHWGSDQLFCNPPAGNNASLGCSCFSCPLEQHPATVIETYSCWSNTDRTYRSIDASPQNTTSVDSDLDCFTGRPECHYKAASKSLPYILDHSHQYSSYALQASPLYYDGSACSVEEPATIHPHVYALSRLPPSGLSQYSREALPGSGDRIADAVLATEPLPLTSTGPRPGQEAWFRRQDPDKARRDGRRFGTSHRRSTQASTRSAKGRSGIQKTLPRPVGRKKFDRLQSIKHHFCDVNLLATDTFGWADKNQAKSIKRRLTCSPAVVFIVQYEMISGSLLGQRPAVPYLKTTVEVVVQLFTSDNRRIWFCGHPTCIKDNGDFMTFRDEYAKWRHDRSTHPPEDAAESRSLGIRVDCPDKHCDHWVIRDKVEDLEKHVRKKHGDLVDKIVKPKHSTKERGFPAAAIGAQNIQDCSFSALLAGAGTSRVRYHLNFGIRCAKDMAKGSNRLLGFLEKQPKPATYHAMANMYRYRHSYTTQWCSDARFTPPRGEWRSKFRGQVNAFLSNLDQLT